MPASCSAYGCTNRCSKGTNIHFYRFPLKNSTLLRLWLKAVKRKNFTPTESSRICSDHFLQSDFTGNTYVRKRLKPIAVPSVFPHFPKHLQPEVKKPRNSYRTTMLLCNNPITDASSLPSTSNTCSVHTCDSSPEEGMGMSPKKKEACVQTDDTTLPSIVKSLKEEILVLKQQVKRQSNHISSLKYLISMLRDNRLMDDNLEEQRISFKSEHNDRS